jgi:PAS domain S-box-containing protein
MRRLSVRLVMGFLVLVLLTALAVGLPAIWLIQNQLDRQIRSQIEQGERSAVSLYEKSALELQNYAILTAQRPTLNSLLQENDLSALTSYLDTLQHGTKLDLINICRSSRLLAGTRTDVPACVEHREDKFYFSGPTENSELWMISRTPLESSSGEVVVGRSLNSDFAFEISAQIGMDQLLFYQGSLINSSLGRNPSLGDQLKGCLISGEEGSHRTSCSLNGKSYFLGSTTLDQPDWVLTVALDASSLRTVQKNLVYSMTAAILVVSLVGTSLGVILSRLVSRPLEELSTTAEAFSRGDLETVFESRSRVEEITQVAAALESARSDLTRTLRSLETEKEWGENLLASIVEAIITVDSRGVIHFFSHGAERLTGLPADEAAGQNIDQIFKLSDDQGPLMDLLSAGPADYQRVDLSLPSGNQMTCAITTAQLNRKATSQQTEKVLVIRDISEEEAVHRLLGHFIADVAHELRTPLTALEASIELLLDQAEELDRTEREELYDSLYLGTLGLHTLVDNLLESANIEARQFRISPREVQLKPIIAGAVQTMKPLLSKYEQRFTLELPLELPPVKADPKRTEQVLVNLISNANRYGPPGEEIILQVTVEANYVRLAVKDRGPGIPPEYKENLFRRFEFPHDENAASQAGAGLGLSVVKEIISAHGGQIEVDNQPGGGSVFWFTLPRVKEEME